MKTALLIAGGIVVLVVMVFVKQTNPMLSFTCFLIGVGMLLFAASLMTSVQAIPVQRVARPVITTTPSAHIPLTIPRSTQELRQRFGIGKEANDTFELFSAAVVIGRRDKDYTFERRVGGSGDQGMDTLLRNRNNLRVGVQSKYYAPDTKVGSEEIRTFVGSLNHHDCIYGYFVTTSTLTADAQVALDKARGTVYLIDARELDKDLYYRAVSIEQAWAHVTEKHNAQQ